MRSNLIVAQVDEYVSLKLWMVRIKRECIEMRSRETRNMGVNIQNVVLKALMIQTNLLR